MKSLNRAIWLTLALVGGNLVFQPVFAAQCKLEGGPAPALSTYIGKVDATLNKIQQAASNASCGNSNDMVPTSSRNLSEAAAAITRGVNTSLVQDSYVEAAEFTTELGLKSEVPPQLRQHLNLLLQKQEDINRAIEAVYRNCGQNTEVASDSIIEGSGKDQVTLGKLAETVLTNHIDVLSVYRTTVLGKPASKSGLLLVPDDFIQKIGESYGPDAQQVCRQEGDVFKKIREAINNLAKTSSSIGKGMAVWQSSDKQTESAYEASMRKKRDTEYLDKLKKAGLNDNVSDASIRAQGNYDIPDKDTGISGFLKNIGNKTVATFEKIKTFYTFTTKVQDAKTTDDWIARYENIDSLQTDIGQEVLLKYAGLMSQIGDAQLNKDIYEGKLGRIYIELELGKKLLEPYRKVAQKICREGQGINTDASGCVPAK